MTAAEAGDVPLAERTVGVLLGLVGSRDPAPGGGAVAGISIALAAGLAGMAARSSDAELDADAAALATRADELRGRATDLAQEDADAYREFLARSRDGDEGRLEALSRATDVPLAIAELGAETAEIAARIVEHGNPNLRGDAATGAVLAEAATRAAATLVALNARAGGFGDDRAERAERSARRAAAARARVEPALDLRS